VAQRLSDRELRRFEAAVHSPEIEASGIELLVDVQPGVDLFDLAYFVESVDEFPGWPVSILRTFRSTRSTSRTIATKLRRCQCLLPPAASLRSAL
jgi:hypothetical protein